MIIATNHADTFILPPEERRLAVLTNGKPPPAEFWIALREWADNPANIAAFVEHMLATDMTGFSAFTAPPLTMLKRDMVDASQSDLDRAITDIFSMLPGDLLTKEQLVVALEDYARDNHAEFPDNWPSFVDNIFRRQTFRVLDEERVTIEGRSRAVRSIKDADELTLDITDAAAVITEVEKNGPQARSIKTSSNIVGFPQRA